MTQPLIDVDRSTSFTPTHAGAVTFRRAGGQTFYLVVSSSNNEHWVLPKGHIDPGETPQVAALRELQEEAGVTGEIVDSVTIQHFAKGEEEVVVEYFLVRELSSTRAEEERRLRWENFQAACELLTFTDARNALQQADAALRQLEPTG
ncbi:MAG: bis(5-nucleosidyl)-tetraphosphatase [Blastocatellia bacterium]|jgi:8-oxo-dGTP pyrophosphatase MutT (NUDIX family)|nr:bis(5-nucleosidyl)-tetraphosphatase [Blastocatellia bacterium]